jgi:tRNA isopentenyl-2-thiomethyl-A-37 hydroxylase MiaE
MLTSVLRNVAGFINICTSKAWVLKKREEQRLESAQMKFLRHLLGITKLDKEKKPMY